MIKERNFSFLLKLSVTFNKLSNHLTFTVVHYVEGSLDAIIYISNDTH